MFVQTLKLVQMNNPFELIDARLNNIETLLLDLKHSPSKQKSTDLSDDLLTVPKAAEFLSLAIPTLYSKASKGELPFMKRGKRLYFSKLELSEYLKAGRKSTNEEILESAGQYVIQRNRRS